MFPNFGRHSCIPVNFDSRALPRYLPCPFRSFVSTVSSHEQPLDLFLISQSACVLIIVTCVIVAIECDLSHSPVCSSRKALRTNARQKLCALETSLLPLRNQSITLLQLTSGTEWQSTAARTPRLQTGSGTACVCSHLAPSWDQAASSCHPAVLPCCQTPFPASPSSVRSRYNPYLFC